MSTEAEVQQNEPLTFLISPGDRAELEMLAKTRERTVSAELRLAVKAYLADQRRITA